MQIIHSILQPALVLAIHYKPEDSSLERRNLSETEDLLQIGVRILPEKFQVAPHRHLSVSNSRSGAIQEVWILIKGTAMAKIFDLDDSVICDIQMEPGDLLTYKNGGHSLINHDAPSILYEVKSGPYLGPANDRERF